MIQLNPVKICAGLVLLAAAVLPVALMENAHATVAGGALLVLTPQDSSNFTGEEHTVTATVTVDGVPVSGVLVDFEVTGAHSEAGVSDTNSNGQAIYIYSGVNIGDDIITASATVLIPVGGQEFIKVDVRDTAQKHWSMFVVPESPVGAIAMISASLAAVAGFVFWKGRNKSLGQ